jgi:Flp pilus assembly protein TadG
MMVLIPLGLVALDLSTLIATQNIQERVVEDAARAAGNQVDQNSASQAAKNSIDSFKPQSLILSITMENCNYNSASGQVAVTTVMNVKLPIPCGDFNIITLRADSLEPIVAMPAPL